jgi:hypothetical protein
MLTAKPKPPTTVNDDSDVVEAREKLADLKRRAAEAEAVYVAERERRATASRAGTGVDLIGEAAIALVTGVATAAPPDLGELQRDAAVLHRACEVQERALSESKREAFAPICREMQPAHARALQDMIAAGESFLQKRRVMQEVVSATLKRGGGAELVSPMQRYDVDSALITRIEFALKQLATLSANYRKGL